MIVDRGLASTKDAVREINAMAAVMRDEIKHWTPRPMPANPSFKGTKPVAVWLDESEAVPVTTPFIDPLLRKP